MQPNFMARRDIKLQKFLVILQAKAKKDEIFKRPAIPAAADSTGRAPAAGLQIQGDGRRETGPLRLCLCQYRRRTAAHRRARRRPHLGHPLRRGNLHDALRRLQVLRAPALHPLRHPACRGPQRGDCHRAAIAPEARLRPDRRRQASRLYPHPRREHPGIARTPRHLATGDVAPRRPDALQRRRGPSAGHPSRTSLRNAQSDSKVCAPAPPQGHPSAGPFHPFRHRHLDLPGRAFPLLACGINNQYLHESIKKAPLKWRCRSYDNDCYSSSSSPQMSF